MGLMVYVLMGLQYQCKYDLGTMMRGDPSGFCIASNPIGCPSTDVMSFPLGGSSVYSLGIRLCFNWCPIH